MNRRLENLIGYKFNNPQLLTIALTHSSYGHRHGVPDYERLEFLGDSVLDMLISDELYGMYPDDEEGALTTKRAFIVKGETLKKVSLSMGLDKYMFINDRSGAEKAYSDVFESITGAIYLDGGIEKAREFVLRFLKDYIEDTKMDAKEDYKSRLKELYEGQKIEYVQVDKSESDNGPIFTIRLLINGKVVAQASGGRKKQAEQNCAKSALKQIGQQPNR
ncbi:MAG: ribonuclease III [Christensenellales bacterium]